MLRLLVLALIVSILPTTAAAADESETVKVLVPRSAVLQSRAAEQPGPSGWVRVELPVTGTPAATLEKARERYGPDAYLERVYRLTAPEDEPMFSDQWAMENTGQFTNTVVDADVDAVAAWSVSLGSGVVVAVVDSGVDATHPDLAGQVVSGWDWVEDDADTRPEGDGFAEAHGTMVAGIVAAAVNGTGITGMAPEATILDMRACVHGECFSRDVALAVVDAVERGADIINLSLGSIAPGDPAVEEAIERARLNGVVVVAAIGNEDPGLNVDEELEPGDIVIPAGLPHDNIISVGASDARDLKATYSNYGPETLDLFAPGDFMRTTATAGLDTYEFVFGTSFAAPLVAGVAALLLSHDPGIGHHELIARVTGFADSPEGLEGMSRHGRVNAGTSLTRRFVDTAGSVFVNTIRWLAEQGITEGCNPPQNHRYCPGENVTRGQMAVFFARAFDLAPADDDYFSDDDGAFYENAANRMAASGVTVGCASDMYCGDRDIRRGEMAAMLSRVLGLPATGTDHFDDDDGSTFESAINRIAEAGITQGCNPPSNDRYCPERNVNRGQMAAFIQRSVNHQG